MKVKQTKTQRMRRDEKAEFFCRICLVPISECECSAKTHHHRAREPIARMVEVSGDYQTEDR